MTDGKRYQVFVSSTYKDLIEERQAVSAALLNINMFPAGMELFPAGNQTAWDLITRVIDVSDYYLLVIGKVYGSVDAAGLSFTEREYDYAVSVGKYVIPLLIDDAADLPGSRTEPDPERRESLSHFRAKVQAAHVTRYWNTAHELALYAVTGLSVAIEQSPQIGWVRGDEATPVLAINELRELRNANERLQKDNDHLREALDGPASAAGLASGSDLFTVELEVIRNARNNFSGRSAIGIGWIELSWDAIFHVLGPELYGPRQVHELNHALTDHITAAHASDTMIDLGERQRQSWSDVEPELYDLRVADPAMNRIVAQFHQLGYLSRSVRLGGVLWVLSDFGSNAISRDLAIHRPDRDLSGPAVSNPTGD